MNKNSEAIYDAKQLGKGQVLILGLQHMFAMFGATVLVPILVSNNYGMPLSIQTTLFFAGIGTLIFPVCSKLKIPAFLGSSFAFLGGFQAVSELNVGKFADMTGAEKLPYAMGGRVDNLHNNAQVKSVEYTAEGIEIEAILDDILYGRLRDYIAMEL